MDQPDDVIILEARHDHPQAIELKCAIYQIKTFRIESIELDRVSIWNGIGNELEDD